MLVERAMVNDVLQADDELGFRNLHATRTLHDARGSYEFRTNTRGFRGPELPTAPAPPGTERVLILGDSFVHAWGIREEEWMGTAVRDALAAAGRPAEVYSLCTQDWGTAQELLALRRYGPAVRPDTVVLVMYPTNDLLNNEIGLAGRSTISANDYFRPYLVPDGEGGLDRRHALPWRALLRRSMIFRLLERRANSGRTADEIRRELVGGDPYVSVDERVANGDVPERHFEIFREPTPGDEWARAWATTDALVLATRAEAQRLGADFQVVVIPNMAQVVRTAFSASYDCRLRAHGREPLEALLDLDLPERRLEAFFHREGLAHLQMLDEFRERARATGEPVFLADGHVDGAAHTAMGRAIAARMARGAADLCMRGGDPPVDLLASRGAPPFELDLEREEVWPFFGFGWGGWISPNAQREHSGWGTAAAGQFVAQPGSYVLRGELTQRCSFPATLVVAQTFKPRRKLARATVAAAGPFELRLTVPDDDAPPDRPWTVLALSLEGVTPPPRTSGAPPRLVLQRMSAAREPLVPAAAAPAARAPGPRARVTLALVAAVVRLPAHTMHLPWGVPRSR